VEALSEILLLWRADCIVNDAGAKRSDHISPVLRQLQWLPVRQRVVFKIATLVDRSLSGHSPRYLADDCQLVTDARVRLLPSTDTRTLTVHRISSCFGDRTFAAAATRVWNSLPSDLRKGFYFRRPYFHGAQFHTQQFASMRKLTTLHCYNIAYLQHGDGNRW